MNEADHLNEASFFLFQIFLVKSAIFLYLFLGFSGSLFSQEDRIAQLDIFWGYLKYNSVSEDIKPRNWDEYYLSLYPKVVGSKNQEELNIVFSEFIGCIDPKGLKNSKKNASFAEISHLNRIDNGLKAYLDYVSNQFGDKRYQMPAPNSFCNENYSSPCFLSEKSYPLDSCKQEKYRSLALAKFWNIINYFYPYKTELGFDWYMVLDNYVDRFKSTSDGIAYLELCRSLNTEILDGHAATSLQGEFARLFQNSVPFTASYENQILVIKQSVSNQLVAGDTILKINGLMSGDYLAQRSDWFKVKNNVCPESILQKMLLSELKETELEVIHQKTKKTITVANVPVKEIISLDRCKNQSIVTDTSVYINPGCFSNEELLTFLEKLPDGLKLIIDLRKYPSFSMDFIGHFVDNEYKYGYQIFPKRNFPGQFTSNEIGIKPKSPNLSGKFSGIEIWIDKETISKGEYMALVLAELPNVTLVGERTSGTLGAMAFIELPGKYVAVFTATGFKNLNNKSLYITGVLPDQQIELKP